MCAIIGYHGIQDLNHLIYLRDLMIKRGPDDAGHYYEENNKLFLGHRRLSIIDHKGGTQPMWSINKKVCVIFNGEIYNHAELRKKLEIKGHKFKSSHSDTEVLLHGYIEWGQNLPEYLNGMFAFCILDKFKNKFFLARDRFGEKPLFYFVNNNIFGFSSEISSFEKCKYLKLDLSTTNLQKYFAYGFFPSSKTMFQKVYKLKPGHCLSYNITKKKLDISEYWNYKLEPDNSLLDTNINHLSENFFDLLINSTKKRLMSDVPLGFFLSGGIDSSSVLAAAKSLNQSLKLNAFTIGFNEKTFDETIWAKMVSKHFDVNHNIKFVNYQDFKNNLKTILELNDIPIADPSIIPTNLLCKFTKKKVTVALSGDGADELLGGYDPFLALTPSKIYSKVIPTNIHKLILKLSNLLPVSSKNLSFDFKVKKTLGGLSYPQEYWAPIWMSLLDPSDIKELFNTYISLENLYSEVISNIEKNKPKSLEESMMYYFTNFYLTDNILTKLDQSSMEHSLETRSVFLDNDLVNFITKLPIHYKIKNGNRKIILKQAMKNVLPNEILNRKKKGFGIPISSWFQKNEIIINDNLKLINTNKLKKIKKDHVYNKKDNSRSLFGVMSISNILKR